ncbi:hypothetical protein [Campylobacter sp.]|nr:hypothetical protein [Campylobacter sp.]
MQKGWAAQGFKAKKRLKAGPADKIYSADKSKKRWAILAIKHLF